MHPQTPGLRSSSAPPGRPSSLPVTTYVATGPGDGGFLVRPAVLADAQALCDLSRAAIMVSAAEHYTLAQRSAWARRRTLAAHRRMIRDTTGFVAAEAGSAAAIGFATVSLTAIGSLERGEVDQLFVHPDHTGRGIAGELLARVETAARAAGLDGLVTHASWRAMPVFERFGYAPLETEAVVVDGLELTRMRMTKLLEG